MVIRCLFPLWLAGSLLPAADSIVYVGTYTRESSRGIYAWRFDPASGKVTSLGLAAEATNPSFLAIHPNRKFLYAVGEISGAGQKGGIVNAFAIDSSTGRLTLLNQVSSKGAGPCHVNVDKTGRAVLVANYGSGSAAAMPVLADGRLGESESFVQHEGSSVNPKRQQGPHAHSVNFSPDNRFAFVADLGLDKILIYRLDPAKASITPHDPPHAAVAPGSGPRHFAFHPGGKFAYVINELASTVTAFAYDAAAGALKELQTVSTLPGDFRGTNSTAEVVVHPSGRFLYGSNRGHDSIALFRIDPRKGTLTAVERTPSGGRIPRNFSIDPSGRWLFAAHQATNNIVVFRLDPKTGRLSATSTVLEAGAPVCVRFLPLD